MSDQVHELRRLTADEKAEVDANAYFTAMEALERAEKHSTLKGVSRADISKVTGMDPSRVTKILNGSERNITLKTLFLIMKAMGRKVFIDSVAVEDLSSRRSNFNFDEIKADFLPVRAAVVRYNRFVGGKDAAY